MNNNRTKFTAEARRAAVEKYLTTDATAKEIATALGCNTVTFRRWVYEHRLTLRRADNPQAELIERLGKIAVEHVYDSESLIAVLAK